MRGPKYFNTLSVSGPNLARNGISVYSIRWGTVFNELMKRADRERWGPQEALVPSLARLGLGALFLGSLRERHPKTFLLTNMATAPDGIGFIQNYLHTTVDEVMSNYSHREIRWDYGWGMGGSPIKDSPAHVIELHDLAPFLPGIMGSGPSEMSFVLMLARGETELERISSVIESIEDPGKWEATVLSTVDILGFPVEGFLFVIKSKQPSVVSEIRQIVGEGN